MLSKLFYTAFLALVYNIEVWGWVNINTRFTNNLQYRLLRNRHRTTMDDEQWLNREDEIIIDNNHDQAPDIYGNFLRDGDSTMFDKMYNSKDMEQHSIARLSLRDISEAYGFSIPYLSDYVASMGCPVPVDIDEMIGNYMIGDQVYTLLLAITSLDPLDANTSYDSLTISELAYEMGLEEEKILEICEGEGIRLPNFGETVLHKDVVEQLRRVADYEIYNVDEKENPNNSFSFETLM